MHYCRFRDFSAHVFMDIITTFYNISKKRRKGRKHTPHTHTRLTALCPGLPRWASTRKVKPIWILLKQETVGGSGISWAIMQVCTSLKTDNHTSTPPLIYEWWGAGVVHQGNIHQGRPNEQGRWDRSEKSPFQCGKLQWFAVTRIHVDWQLEWMVRHESH